MRSLILILVMALNSPTTWAAGLCRSALTSPLTPVEKFDRNILLLSKTLNRLYAPNEFVAAFSRQDVRRALLELSNFSRPSDGISTEKHFQLKADLRQLAQETQTYLRLTALVETAYATRCDAAVMGLVRAQATTAKANFISFLVRQNWFPHPLTQIKGVIEPLSAKEQIQLLKNQLRNTSREIAILKRDYNVETATFKDPVKSLLSFERWLRELHEILATQEGLSTLKSTQDHLSVISKLVTELGVLKAYIEMETDLTNVLMIGNLVRERQAAQIYADARVTEKFGKMDIQSSLAALYQLYLKADPLKKIETSF